MPVGIQSNEGAFLGGLLPCDHDLDPQPARQVLNVWTVHVRQEMLLSDLHRRSPMCWQTGLPGVHAFVSWCEPKSNGLFFQANVQSVV